MKDKFTFYKDGLGMWQWTKEGEVNANSQTGFHEKTKAVKNAKRYGYVPGENDEAEPATEEKPAPTAAKAPKAKDPKPKSTPVATAGTDNIETPESRHETTE